MKFFKKKKSDKNLASTLLQEEQSTLVDSPLSSSILKKPINDSKIKSSVLNTSSDIGPNIRNSPILVMPKPRKLLTPTRAILGRFDNDKTQVEDEIVPTETKNIINQHDISPILLPTPREDSNLPQLVKTKSRQPQMPTISSFSTVQSDDSSSRVYESARESVSDSTNEDQLQDIADAFVLKKQPSGQLYKKPVFQETEVLIESAFKLDNHQKQQQKKSATAGQSSTSSATVTPLLQQQQQQQQQQQEPFIVNKPEPINDYYPQKETKKLPNDQELILQELKKQIEFMEQQRIKDREEWNRKEQELLSHRQKMMETLIETKDQLTSVLKNREENNNKANIQKQLHQQQIYQLQQQVAEMTIHHHPLPNQPLQYEQEQDEQDLKGGRRSNPTVYQQRNPYEYDYVDDDDDEDVAFQHVKVMDDTPKRTVNKSRSEEYLRYNTRSSSRSSNRYQNEFTSSRQAYYNEGNKSVNSSRNNNNMSGDESMSRKSLSRKSSTASNKSGHRHPSPSATLVPTPHQRRPRTKSIESIKKWHEEQGPMMMRYNDEMIMDEPTAVAFANQRVYKPRRSRSVGKESKRPSSRSSSVYYQDEEIEDDTYDDYYENGYYGNYADNIPPYKQQAMRYNPDIPYYVQQQVAQQQPQQYNPMYTANGYFYHRHPSQPVPVDPRLMYGMNERARHHYSYT